MRRGVVLLRSPSGGDGDVVGGVGRTSVRPVRSGWALW